ncbi:MAG: hypothetical protein PHS14_20910 [Elusimicrobia bacterium]|nr:hypothetical protein [Elusimicrobiota bacterium]
MAIQAEVIPDFTPTEDSVAGSLIRAGVQLVQVENDTIRAIAIAKPRDEEKVLAGALRELELVPDEASKNYYVIPYKDHVQGCADRKKCNCPSNNVEGPSVKAARALIRRWGNCSVSSGRIISEDDRQVMLQAVVIDFETGYRKDRVFPVSKWGTKFKGAGVYKLSDDKVAKALAIGASKVERNAILESLPAYLVASYYRRAREIAAGKKPEETWDGAKKGAGLVRSFAKIGVTQEMLEGYLKHAVAEITEEEYADLIGIGNAIKDRQVTVEDAFAVSGQPAEETNGGLPDELDGATARIENKDEKK